MISSYNMRTYLQQHARRTDAGLALTLALARPCAFVGRAPNYLIRAQL